MTSGNGYRSTSSVTTARAARFLLTAGQSGDALLGENLIEGLPADFVMADTAYDSDKLRAIIAAKGAVAVIPNNPSRTLTHPLDEPLYAQRHLVECCFSSSAIPTRRNSLREDRSQLLRRRQHRR